MSSSVLYDQLLPTLGARILPALFRRLKKVANDADGHVFEIDESWDTYADPAYGDRWPRDRNAARVRFPR